MGTGAFTGQQPPCACDEAAKLGERPARSDDVRPSSSQSGRAPNRPSSSQSGRVRLKKIRNSLRKTSGQAWLHGWLGRLHTSNHAQRRIRWTSCVADLYALGREVFPSTHAGMKVLHATRLADKKVVVVKVRGKKESFFCSQDEREWRTSTEFIMNMPESSSIVQLFDVLEDSKNYYVVMEKAGGMDLFETLDCHGRLPINDCKEIIRQLVKAVAELHGRGCIHKDLKLENVMVDRSQIYTVPTTASLSDLGAEGVESGPIVKLIDFDTVEPQAWCRKPTSIVGTDQYIAQEAYAGKYSPASDIFAVGVIAYRLLTGRFPFCPRIFDDEAGENYVGSPKMKQIQERLQSFDINFCLPPFHTEPLACELVKSMLSVNESERPQAEVALGHPWLASQNPVRGPRELSQAAKPDLGEAPVPPALPSSRPCSQEEPAREAPGLPGTIDS